MQAETAVQDQVPPTTERERTDGFPSGVVRCLRDSKATPMPWRYSLVVTPIETRWRVSVLDDVATVPERLCDADDRREAVQRAREFATEFASLGDEAQVIELG